MKLNIKDIQRLLEKDKIQWSGHILTRAQQRGLKIKDIINCVNTGEIIEYYVDDYPYPSSLILGYSDAGIGIHVVCAIGGNYLWMITAYIPNEKEWLKDLKTRRR